MTHYDEIGYHDFPYNGNPREETEITRNVNRSIINKLTPLKINIYFVDELIFNDR